jgi:large subunit ribosomal protein L3
MINALLGTKIGQTQTFTEAGMRIPVTAIAVGPNWITHIDNAPTYKNIQLGFGTAKKLSKAEEGHLKKAGLTTKLRFLHSFRVDEIGETDTLGAEIAVETVFAVGDKVRVIGTSKGKGFAGVVKRHNFRGGPRTHGQSDRERAPGSIGQTTTPGRVYKGKRMAGRMGSDTVTVRGLKVVAVDPNKKTILVKGVVPGGVNGLLIVAKEPSKK